MCLVQVFTFFLTFTLQIFSWLHNISGGWLKTLLTPNDCFVSANSEQKHLQHRCLELIFWRESRLRDSGCGRASSVVFLQPSDTPFLWRWMLPSHDTDAVPLSRSRHDGSHVNAPRRHSKYTFWKDNWWHHVSIRHVTDGGETVKLWSVIAWKSPLRLDKVEIQVKGKGAFLYSVLIYPVSPNWFFDRPVHTDTNPTYRCEAFSHDAIIDYSHTYFHL